MSYYSFTDTKSGQSVEVEFPIGTAPKIGSVIIRGKRRLKRVPDFGQVLKIGLSHEFRSDSLPRHHPDAPRLDSKGRPVFLSKREVVDFVAKHNGKSPKSMHYEYGVD